MRYPIVSPAALVMAVLPLGACSIDVNRHDSGRSTDVDIRTPAGTVAVRTSVPAEGTGLAVYPNAWPARGHGHDESADVQIARLCSASTSSPLNSRATMSRRRWWRFTATRWRAMPRTSMPRTRPLASQRPPHLPRRPVTRGRAGGRVENRQRIVVVKPQHDGGTEFALVYVSTSD